jgi:hypothetical protein
MCIAQAMRATLLADAVTVRMTPRQVLRSFGTSGTDRIDPMATTIGSRIRYSRATALYRYDACLALRILEWMRTMPMKLAGTIASSQRPATHDPALQPRVLIRPQPLTYSDPLPAGRDIRFFTYVPCILQAGLSSTILGPTEHWCAFEPTGSNSAVLTQLAQYPLA